MKWKKWRQKGPLIFLRLKYYIYIQTWPKSQNFQTTQTAKKMLNTIAIMANCQNHCFELFLSDCWNCVDNDVGTVLKSGQFCGFLYALFYSLVQLNSKFLACDINPHFPVFAGTESWQINANNDMPLTDVNGIIPWTFGICTQFFLIFVTFFVIFLILHWLSF